MNQDNEEKSLLEGLALELLDKIMLELDLSDLGRVRQVSPPFNFFANRVLPSIAREIHYTLKEKPSVFLQLIAFVKDLHEDARYIADWKHSDVHDILDKKITSIADIQRLQKWLLEKVDLLNTSFINVGEANSLSAEDESDSSSEILGTESKL